MANSATRKLILEEANRRGWGTQEIGPNAYFIKIIHPDGRSNVLRGSQPRQNSALSFFATRDKSLALDFVSSYGYTIPAYELVASVEAANAFLIKNGRIVLKPLDSFQSRGVTVNITKPEQVQAAFDLAMQFSRSGQAIVQEHIDGNLYRVTLIDGQVVAATWRTAITVTGDGSHTVTELIAELNKDTRRGEAPELGLKHINLETTSAYMGAEIMQSIPTEGQVVTVSSMDSEPGGGAVNVTDQVHQDWRDFVKKMSAELGLFITGFDFICPDIARPIEGKNIPLLEINGAPGMRIHRFPTAGEPIDLAPILLDALFPPIDK